MVGRKYVRRSSFVDTPNQLSDMNPLKDEQKEGSHESDKKRRQQMMAAAMEKDIHRTPVAMLGQRDTCSMLGTHRMVMAVCAGRRCC